MSATLLRDSWGYGWYFCVYDILKSFRYPIQPDGTRETIPILYTMAIGSITGIIMWISCFPFDVIKTEMQNDNLKNPKFKSTLHAAQQIQKNYGFGGFFRGLTPCATRAIPVNAAIFTTFELSMKMLNKWTE